MRTACVWPGCSSLSKGRGLCERHWQQAKRDGVLGRFAKKPLGTITACPHVDRKHRAKGMCGSCYTMAWQRAHPEAPNASDWLKAHPKAARRHRRRATLKRQHGITLEQYEAMWRAQGGRCANPRCRRACALMAMDFRRNGLQVDHCHKTGRRRGLLCPPCNRALGSINDHVDRMRGLIEYLLA